MSSKTIASYNQFRADAGRPVPRPVDVTGVRPSRETPTTPPPAPSSHGNDILRHAEALVEQAMRILARADELRESAEKLGATSVCLQRYDAVRGQVE